MKGSQREIQEAVSRGVAVMAYCHRVGSNPRTKQLIRDEAGEIAELLMSMGLDSLATDRWIFRPLRRELLALYGPEPAAGLGADFIAAFSGVQSLHSAGV